VISEEIVGCQRLRETLCRVGVCDEGCTIVTHETHQEVDISDRSRAVQD